MDARSLTLICERLNVGDADWPRPIAAFDGGDILMVAVIPDVDAGHRVGRVPNAQILKVADEVIRDESMASLLARVDAVHVLTSLKGFEALLRRLEVTAHGHPF